MKADWAVPFEPDLAGRVAIVTGGSRGLGLAIAEAYMAAGADVAICARDAGALRAAEHSLRERAPARRVTAIVADVSTAGGIETVVSQAIERLGAFDVVVSNAGIHGSIAPLEEADESEWRRAVEVNLIGPMLLFRRTAPLLRAKGKGKIIQISGGGATGARPRFSAYAASKTAVVRLVETLAAELEGTGVDVNAIAPGALPTALGDEILAAGPARAGVAAVEEATRARSEGVGALQRAARLAVFLASDRSDGVTGRLISAVWDPWESLADRVDDLAQSDVYTLRRIVPADRGLGW